MVFDHKPNVALSFPAVVWLFCAIISIITYLGKVDIKEIGLITWLVFLGGIIYCVLSALFG